jgi:hypothetical protein
MLGVTMDKLGVQERVYAEDMIYVFITLVPEQLKTDWYYYVA